jgi:hypothetical protein
MSSDLAKSINPGRALNGASRNAIFRLAFGVTACFVLVEALGWDATFLAPLLASSMLVKLERPPSLKQGVALVILMLASTGVVLAITTALIGSPAVLILALTTLINLAFYAHRQGAPPLATLLIQISAVALPTIAVVSPNGANAFATTLVLAGVVALLTVWAAHAAFPAPVSDGLVAVAAHNPASLVDPALAARHAFFDTLVVLPVLIWYVLDATQTAVVVLIIILTVLRQQTPQQGKREVLNLILGNLTGGIAAALVYNLVLVSNTLPFFTAVCMAASLMFASRIMTGGDRTPLYSIALSTFVLLLGLGMSPLPGGSGEAFVGRLLHVLLASAYTLGALSLLADWRHRRDTK